LVVGGDGDRRQDVVDLSGTRGEPGPTPGDVATPEDDSEARPGAAVIAVVVLRRTKRVVGQEFVASEDEQGPCSNLASETRKYGINHRNEAFTGYRI
jgi:hypothetical protein